MPKSKAEMWLEEYPSIPKEILRLNQVLNYAIESRKYADANVKAVIISDMPKATKQRDRMSEAVENLVDNLDVIAKRIEKDVEDVKQKINRLLHKKKVIDDIWVDDVLTKDEKRILELKYFNNASWQAISFKISYSERQIYRLHKSAIQKINEKIENTAVNVSQSVL